MNSLKELCKKCEHNLSLSGKCCAFRSMSNEHCEEYEKVAKDLEAFEIIKKYFKFDNSIYSDQYFTLDKPISSEDSDLLKERLCKK